MSSLFLFFVSLCPNLSVSVYLFVSPSPLLPPPLSLPPSLSLHYSTSFLSPVKVTSNRTSSASVTSSVSSRGSSPGLESFNTKVTPDEMSDGEFYYYCNNNNISWSLSLPPLPPSLPLSLPLPLSLLQLIAYWLHTLSLPLTSIFNM